MRCGQDQAGPEAQSVERWTRVVGAHVTVTKTRSSRRDGASMFIRHLAFMVAVGGMP